MKNQTTGTEFNEIGGAIAAVAEEAYDLLEQRAAEGRETFQWAAVRAAHGRQNPEATAGDDADHADHEGGVEWPDNHCLQAMEIQALYLILGKYTGDYREICGGHRPVEAWDAISTLICAEKGEWLPVPEARELIQ